jgi:dephospho-CoA kinase
MLIVGLTGGIASGKSLVARMLERKGALVLDADAIAREVVAPGAPAWREIVDWLGESILLADGSIDRGRLGRLVFSDAAARQKLNAIVHPRVGQELIDRTGAIERRNPGAVLVYDVPLLIEAGMQQHVDRVLLVYVTPEIQLQRLQRRDKLTRDEALARVKAQMPLEEKKNYAHTVIDNNGTIRQTARQVARFWADLVRSR